MAPVNRPSYADFAEYFPDVQNCQICESSTSGATYLLTRSSFVSFMKHSIKNLTANLDSEKADEFKKGIESGTKFLLGKLKDLQL